VQLSDAKQEITIIQQGIRHLAFTVSDLDTEIIRMAEKGSKVIQAG